MIEMLYMVPEAVMLSDGTSTQASFRTKIQHSILGEESNQSMAKL